MSTYYNARKPPVTCPACNKPMPKRPRNHFEGHVKDGSMTKDVEFTVAERRKTVRTKHGKTHRSFVTGVRYVNYQVTEDRGAMSKRGRPGFTGKFATREELVAAIIAARESSPRKPDEVCVELGITRSHYEGIVRGLIKRGVIPKRKRGRLLVRGRRVVVRQQGSVEMFTPEEIIGLLDYLSMRGLPEDIADVVVRLRRVAEARYGRSGKRLREIHLSGEDALELQVSTLALQPADALVIKECGGGFSSVRGGATIRFVFVPDNPEGRKVAAAVRVRYGDGDSVVITRPRPRATQLPPR